MAYNGEPLPRGVSIMMTAGILTMIASVILILALFTWQPWRESTTTGGIQGGSDTPVPEHQRTLPLIR